MSAVSVSPPFPCFPSVPPLTATVSVVNRLWPQNKIFFLFPHWDLHGVEKVRLLEYVNRFHFGGDAGSD